MNGTSASAGSAKLPECSKTRVGAS
jgi:hypothetical protein